MSGTVPLVPDRPVPSVGDLHHRQPPAADAPAADRGRRHHPARPATTAGHPVRGAGCLSGPVPGAGHRRQHDLHPGKSPASGRRGGPGLHDGVGRGGARNVPCPAGVAEAAPPGGPGAVPGISRAGARTTARRATQPDGRRSIPTSRARAPARPRLGHLAPVGAAGPRHRLPVFARGYRRRPAAFAGEAPGRTDADGPRRPGVRLGGEADTRRPEDSH